MFGDYECPPCRNEWPSLVQLVNSRPGTVALYFRNLPLPELHPHALEAAVAAEVGKANGKFLDMQRLLYAAPLSSESVALAYDALGITSTQEESCRMRAEEIVSGDLNFAHAIGLASTPTLFLIDEDGKVHNVADSGSLGILLPKAS
jgi:protein-disulfide isomerase